MEGWVSIDTHPMQLHVQGDSIIGGNLDVNAELYVVGNVLISNDADGARLHLGKYITVGKESSKRVLARKRRRGHDGIRSTGPVTAGAGVVVDVGGTNIAV
jgi:hypothetical protein